MADGPRLRPVERKMLDVLSDGKPHTPQELQACLWDEQGPLSTVRVHLTCLRKKLRPRGQDVAVQILGGRTTYTLVAVPTPPPANRR
jgi:DNA-binding CsgD family transcriptional regulator